MPKGKTRWTVTALTIPVREPYLKKLIASINETPINADAEIAIIYNAPTKENPFDVEERIKSFSKNLPLTVYFNSHDTSIAGGRNFQLSVCKSPLICFVDDDLTLHGEIFPALEQTLRETPVGLLGVRSFQDDTAERFKPRDSTPHVDFNGLRYMPVQGMLVAGYKNLFVDTGGFNLRRKFWGEWTEFNLRLWRNGFPTAYQLNTGYLRHWNDAPESPTRNKVGRESHVLWGLICTALEYDAVDINEATEAFWQLIEERYLAYSFGENLSIKNLLRTTLELMPRLSSEWGNISAFKQLAAQHPFQFMPFHPLTTDDVSRVLQFASERIVPYRESVWGKSRPKVTLSDIGEAAVNAAVKNVKSLVGKQRK
jgi:glycosyltransferase involved in cell wall biosynthesis